MSLKVNFSIDCPFFSARLLCPHDAIHPYSPHVYLIDELRSIGQRQNNPIFNLQQSCSTFHPLLNLDPSACSLGCVGWATAWGAPLQMTSGKVTVFSKWEGGLSQKAQFHVKIGQCVLYFEDKNVAQNLQCPRILNNVRKEIFFSVFLKNVLK